MFVLQERALENQSYLILVNQAQLNLSWLGYLSSKIFILLIISAFQSLAFVLVGNSIMEIHGMYFQYWLMLFSTWTIANIMGLIISDAFKTVVTVYILIPFLIIPQIILSGVLVKYDQLNPEISSPTSIPWFGEIIASRWAYEALAVEQFKNNDFEKIFYPYNKLMSEATFKKDYWLKELENKLAFINRHYKDQDKIAKTSYMFKLIRYELKKLINTNPNFNFAQIDELYIDKYNKQVIKNLESFFKEIRMYYISMYNNASYLKDNTLDSLRTNPENKIDFVKLKLKYANKQLNDFVRNSNSFDRIIEYNGRLYQKMDPIYQDPENSFIRAHFYSPYKRIFNYYFPTYNINFIIIWFMNILLFIALYRRWLVKLLNISTLIKRYIKED